MQRLIDGYKQFRQTYFQDNRDMFGRLAKRQSPRVMVISCSDSRVDPTIIFRAEPGEIFALRNVANLVPPYSPDDAYHGTSAALEFAVRALKVEHIVVLGHARCGGVQALLGAHEGDFIGPWMRIAEPARDRALARVGEAQPERLQTVCEHETIQVSLANLRTFPWVVERLEAGLLALHGWYFDIEQGDLQLLDERTGEFASAG